jgi:hypothetical protein
VNAVLERMERQAVRLGAPDPDVDLHLDLLEQLGEVGGQSWDAHGDVLEDAGLPARVRENALRSREARLLGLRSPKAAYGPFRQMYDGAIALADQTAVTGTTETALYPSAQYTGFAANQLRAGQIWQLILFGIGTTPGASMGNITLTPRFGTTTAGTSLGASTAAALVASATNKLWQLEMYLVVRSVGLAGANSNVVASGRPVHRDHARVGVGLVQDARRHPRIAQLGAWRAVARHPRAFGWKGSAFR